MNPLAHGIGWSEMVVDLTLRSKQRSLVIDVARPSEYENIIARNWRTKWASDVDTHIWSLESKRWCDSTSHVEKGSWPS